MAHNCHSQRGHDNWVRSVRVGNLGKCFYSCSDDKSVRVWDLNSGRNTKTIADAHSVRARSSASYIKTLHPSVQAMLLLPTCLPSYLPACLVSCPSVCMFVVTNPKMTLISLFVVFFWRCVCSTLSLQWLSSPTNVAWQQEGWTASSTFGRAAKEHTKVVYTRC